MRPRRMPSKRCLNQACERGCARASASCSLERERRARREGTHHGLLALDAVREADARGAVLAARDAATWPAHDDVCGRARRGAGSARLLEVHGGVDVRDGGRRPAGRNEAPARGSSSSLLGGARGARPSYHRTSSCTLGTTPRRRSARSDTALAQPRTRRPARARLVLDPLLVAVLLHHATAARLAPHTCACRAPRGEGRVEGGKDRVEGGRGRVAGGEDAQKSMPKILRGGTRSTSAHAH